MSVRSIHWGTGAMGRRALELALRDPALSVAAVVSARGRERAAAVLRELAPEAPETVAATGTIGEAVAESGGAEVVLLATGARIGEITPQIVTACELGLNVVCIGEDAIFPAAVSAEYAALIDAAARAHAVSVVGTGINPGFVMDMLPLVLTAPMRCWKTLHVRRVSDLSGYGESVLRSLGIGLAPQEFDASVSRDGVGHVGFSGSVCFVAAGLGVEVESCTEEAIPITRNAVTVLGERSFPSGRVIGVNQRCRATTSSGQTITLEHPQTVGMLEDEAHDLIEVSGDPGVRLRISPGYDGGAATVALLLNLAAAAPSLPPGLQPMSALPLAAMLSSRTAFAEAAVEAA